MEEPGTSKRGRPRSSDFSSLTKRQRRNRLKVYDDIGSDELLAATKKSFHFEGERSAENVLSNLENSSTKGKQIEKIIKNCPSKSFTPEKALSLMYK